MTPPPMSKQREGVREGAYLCLEVDDLAQQHRTATHVSALLDNTRAPPPMAPPVSQPVGGSHTNSTVEREGGREGGREACLP